VGDRVMKNPLTKEQVEVFAKKHNYKNGDSFWIMDSAGNQCKYTVGSDEVFGMVNMTFNPIEGSIRRFL
jgi:hypothetical protein